MRRVKREDETEVAGQDSFLDVVANIVGILILLVMVVGLRSGRLEGEAPAPEAAAPPAPLITNEQVAEAKKTAIEAVHRVAKLKEQLLEAQQEAEVQDAMRLGAADAVLELKENLESKTERLSSSQRRDLELRQNLYLAQKKLEDLTREQVTLASFSPAEELIESRPTPIGRGVTGEEIHVRVSGGRAAVLPHKALLDGVVQQARSELWRLESKKFFDAYYGPIDGFRIRCRVVKIQVRRSDGATGYMTQPVLWEIEPTTDQVGEPVEAAMARESYFMSQIRNLPARSTTITLWPYPDSFAEMSKLKKKLTDLGYTVAVRPLPEGVLIGGSPSGTATVAQ